MISKHCGERLIRLDECQTHFRRKCRKCGLIFKQRKRKAGEKPDIVYIAPPSICGGVPLCVRDSDAAVGIVKEEYPAGRDWMLDLGKDSFHVYGKFPNDESYQIHIVFVRTEIWRA